jgi:spore maturation protein CgeB/glycosyltransferase involved in cell wall biosynthesis/SAM-dependent methyltransferase
MMKILFCFPEADVPNRAGSYAHHNLRAPLVKLGHEMIDFDFWEEMKQLGRDGMHRKLKDILEKEKPEIFFHGIVEDEIDRGFLDNIRDNTATTSIALFSDDDWRFNHSIQWVNHYNFALTQCHEAYSEFIKKGHHNVIMTQWGCNTDLYYPVEGDKKYDVTFVGQPYLGRPDMIAFLKDNGISVNVWGAGWENFPKLRDIAYGFLPHFKMLENFSSSRIVLGMAWCSADGTTPQIKGRLFEYAGCRAFQITNYDKRVTEYFEENKEIVFYRNKDDLVDKIGYYLKHEDERNSISESAYNRVLKEHTWDLRFQHIFEEMTTKLPKGKASISLTGNNPRDYIEARSEQKPKVAVVSYVYNYSMYLDEMIKSVLNQTFTDFEFLILDDGSTDNTGEVVKKYLEDKRLRYVYQDNIGKALRFDELIRRVLDMTTGEYVVFIGGDDVFLPDRLDKALAVFADDPALDVVFSNLTFIDANGNPMEGDFSCEESLSFTRQNLLRTLFKKNIIAHPAAMLKRKAIEHMGGFETGFAPDFHFWAKSAPYLNFKFIEDKLLKYRVHEKGASTGSEMRDTCIRESIKAAHNLRDRFTILDFYPEIELCKARAKALHDAYLELGNLFLTGNLPVPTLAILELQHALQHDPDSKIALNNMGIAHILLSNLLKAHETFQKLKNYPNITEDMRRNIEIVEKVVEGRSSDAASFAVVNEGADNSELLTHILNTKRSNDPCIVLEVPDKHCSGKGDSLFREMYHNVEMLVGEGKYDESMAFLGKLIDSYPDNAELYSDMGVLHYKKGDTEKALQYIEKALTLNPKQRDAQLNLASIYLEDGRIDNAIDIYKQIIDDDPENVEAFEVLARLSLQAGSCEDARMFYERILSIEPENATALSGIEQLHRENKKDRIAPEEERQEAVEWITKELKEKNPAIVNHPNFNSYVNDFAAYICMDGHEDLIKMWPCLDENQSETPLDKFYFYQDTWAARKIFELSPEKVVDVGSTALLVGIVAQLFPTISVDIRPLPVILPKLECMRGDILNLPFEDDSVELLSSMCVIEHVGLGRYSDALDTQGSFKALKEVARVIRPGGHILFSVPLSHTHQLSFNAHRIFTKSEILSLIPGFTIEDELFLYPDPGTESFTYKLPDFAFCIWCADVKKAG